MLRIDSILCNLSKFKANVKISLTRTPQTKKSRAGMILSPILKIDSDSAQNINTWNTAFSVGWRRGISPPRSHRSGRKPLDLSGSSHLIDFYNRLCFSHRLLPSLVDQILKPDELTPSLHPHYRDFITTTS